MSSLLRTVLKAVRADGYRHWPLVPMAIVPMAIGIGSFSFSGWGVRSRSSLHYSVFTIVYCIFISCNSDPKFQQYFVEGEQLYQAHCSNCHQKDGKGLKLVYPPLAQSDYMEENPEKVLCLMKQGIQGQVRVNGKIFDQPMPGIPSLTELEIAEIATFIYNS